MIALYHLYPGGEIEYCNRYKHQDSSGIVEV